jgi:hypothetical protein
LKEIAQFIQRKRPEGATTSWWVYVCEDRRSNRRGIRTRAFRSDRRSTAYREAV